MSASRHRYGNQRPRAGRADRDRTPACSARPPAACTQPAGCRPFERAPEWTADDRERLLQRWYRDRMRELAPRLMKKWQDKLDVEVRAWGIKRMKTKWGSCNPEAQRIWLNLELIKKPPACLEYVLVHELTHLLARNHDERFLRLMDRHLPTWRLRRAELNAAPLAQEAWGC